MVIPSEPLRWEQKVITLLRLLYDEELEAAEGGSCTTLRPSPILSPPSKETHQSQAVE